MAVQKKKTDRAYLFTLRKIRELITQEYKDGGWLLSGRDMSERLNVNRKTYARAIKCVEHDNFVRAYPKKGHYVLPELLRPKKIGFIISEAEICPFIRSSQIITSAIQELDIYGFDVQIINISDQENIMDMAMIHGVLGLIWFFPPPNAHPYLNMIGKNDELPILSLSEGTDLLKTDNSFSYVCPNQLKFIETAADFFIKRKHRKVAYIVSRASTYTETFIDMLHTAGIETLFIVNDENGNMANLDILEKDTEITGLRFEVKEYEFYQLMERLSKLNTSNFRDIYLNYSRYFPHILKLYPKIKITAIARHNKSALGKAAAKMMVEYLTESKPLLQKQVDLLTTITPS